MGKLHAILITILIVSVSSSSVACDSSQMMKNGLKEYITGSIAQVDKQNSQYVSQQQSKIDQMKAEKAQLENEINSYEKQLNNLSNANLPNPDDSYVLIVKELKGKLDKYYTSSYIERYKAQLRSNLAGQNLDWENMSPEQADQLLNPGPHNWPGAVDINIYLSLILPGLLGCSNYCMDRVTKEIGWNDVKQYSWLPDYGVNIEKFSTDIINSHTDIQQLVDNNNKRKQLLTDEDSIKTKITEKEKLIKYAQDLPSTARQYQSEHDSLIGLIENSNSKWNVTKMQGDNYLITGDSLGFDGNSNCSGKWIYNENTKNYQPSDSLATALLSNIKGTLLVK